MLQRIEYALATLLLAAIVVLVGIAAVTRAYGAPIIWSVEVAQLLFLWLTVLAADLGLQHERHFGLQILLDNVPAKTRRMIELANMAVLMALLGFLLVYAWKNMILMHPRLDGALQIPGSWFHASMVVGFLLLMRTLAMQMVALWRREEIV